MKLVDPLVLRWGDSCSVGLGKELGNLYLREGAHGVLVLGQVWGTCSRWSVTHGDGRWRNARVTFTHFLCLLCHERRPEASRLSVNVRWVEYNAIDQEINNDPDKWRKLSKRGGNFDWISFQGAALTDVHRGLLEWCWGLFMKNSSWLWGWGFIVGSVTNLANDWWNSLRNIMGILDKKAASGNLG